MTAWPGQRTLCVVSACMTRSGRPELVLNEVAVTFEEYENGVHYLLVEELLQQAGYEEPCVHFDEMEAPDFLLPAVKEHLAVAPLIIPFPTP